jgi:hypothetical protein
MEASFEIDDEVEKINTTNNKAPGSGLKELIREIEFMINDNDKTLDAIQDKFLLLQSLQELDSVVGMKRLKDTVSLQVKKLLLDKRLPVSKTKKMMSVIFYGPPGTGKSSVGRIYAKILYSLGYLNDPKKQQARDSKNEQGKFGIMIILFFLLGYLFSFIAPYINKYVIYAIIIIMLLMFIYIAKNLWASGKSTLDINGMTNNSKFSSSGNDKEVFKVVTKEDLVAGYLGQSPIKTLKVLEENRGKVLFIDEAYSICRDERDFFGKECLDTITNFLTENPEYVVMFAGYEKEMKKSILKVQPGLIRRCMYVMTCDPYTGKELYEIFRRQMSKDGFNNKYDPELLEFFEKNCKSFANFGGDTERLLYYSQLYFSEDNYRNQNIKKKFNISQIKKGFNDLLMNNRNCKQDMDIEDIVSKKVAEFMVSKE